MDLEIDGLDPHPPAFRATPLASSRLRTEPRRESPPADDADPADVLYARRALEIARRTRLVRAAKIRKLRRCRCGRFQRCRCDELDEKELDAVLPDDGRRYAFALEGAQAGKALDGETVARVRELIAAGVSRREVGRRLGIDRYAVRVIASGGIARGESGAGGAAAGVDAEGGLA